MRLTIDGFVRSETFGGFITYIQSLAKHMAAIQELDVTVVVPKGFSFQYLKELESCTRLNISWADEALSSHSIADQGAWYRNILPNQLDRLCPEVHLGPAFMLPEWPGRKIVTIHDLLFQRSPELYSPQAVQHLNQGVQRALSIADAALVVSEFVRQEVQQLTSTDVPLFVTELAPNEALSATGGKSNIDLGGRQLILNVGGAHPRKRLDILLKEFSLFRQSSSINEPAVLALIGCRNSRSVEEQIQDLGLSGSVITTPQLTMSELSHWYAAADIFVYLSEYEGFGLTPLEAMAFGVPVVTWAGSAVSEVCGAAALFAGREPGTVAQLLRRVTADRRLHQELSRAGIERSQRFSWRDTAARTAAACESVIRGS